jgi:hypothetical protein
MPVNYYPQKSADELLVMLDALQKRATTGFVSQTSAAGLQQIRSFQNSGPVSVEIRRVLYSLWKLDPDTYENPYASRIRRTRPNYTAPTKDPHQVVLLP